MVDYNATVASLAGRNLVFSGTCRVFVTDSVAPLAGSVLDLASDDVWLFFPSIRPSRFDSLYRGQILVAGRPAVVGTNVRFDQYLQGTVVIAHPATYKALDLHGQTGLGGSAFQPEIYTAYKSAQLGALDNTFRSFRLRHGYMATLAANEDGTGESRVYVADREDLVVDLPVGLAGAVSFVRVFPWRWTAKKGWTNGKPAADALRSHWWYDWNNGEASTLDLEYVPMRHDLNGSDYGRMNSKQKVTHALGFNEPDRPDQANASVDAALAQWPELLKSGLRLGAPSPSDASAGLDWLYAFLAKADSLHYRVDFIPVHWYKGGQTSAQFYSWLKAVHDRTRRPIWITEWNNGANWTCCKPTYEEQASTIGKMIDMMDTARFVERYSIYEWVEDTRQMFLVNPTTLNPAGVVYRDNVSPMALDEGEVQLSQGGCLSSPISPNVLLRGVWTQSPYITVQPGDSVSLSPWPWAGGTWSWKGPNGYAATDRTIVLTGMQASKAGEYVATHTNAAGCTSRLSFRVFVATPTGIGERRNAGRAGAWLRDGVVHVVGGVESPVRVVVTDLRGRELWSATATESGEVRLPRTESVGCRVVRVEQEGVAVLVTTSVLFEQGSSR